MLAKTLCLLLLVTSNFAGCPTGTVYESGFNKCYKYVSQATNFLAAEKSCNSMGGSLVSVSNAFENSYIDGMASVSSPAPSYWIGANLLVSARWSWTNGDNSSYQNWAPGQPSDPSIYQCGAVRNVDNQWTKELCSSAKPYMCQIDPNAAPINGCPTTTASPVTVTTATPSGSCPNGHCADPSYTLNPDTCKCYKYYGCCLKYNESAQACLNYNATLPIILDEADNQFIVNFTYQTCGECAPWIGLWCTTNSSSSCTWQDGTPLGYSNFASGFPHANQGVYMSTLTQLWYSYVPSLVFICQQTAIRRPGEPRLLTETLPGKYKEPNLPNRNV